MQVKVETDLNKATLSWSVGDSNEFSPRDLAGTYTCEAKNEYRTVTERLFLPADVMDKHGEYFFQYAGMTSFYRNFKDSL